MPTYTQSSIFSSEMQCDACHARGSTLSCAWIVTNHGRMAEAAPVRAEASVQSTQSVQSARALDDDDDCDGDRPFSVVPVVKCQGISLGASYSDPDIVTLDVGGQLFKTRRSTLMSRSVYFQRMWNPQFVFAEAAESTVFLDRDPVLFRHVLAYLRNPRVHMSCDVLPELEYFGIPIPASMQCHTDDSSSSSSSSSSCTKPVQVPQQGNVVGEAAVSEADKQAFQEWLATRQNLGNASISGAVAALWRRGATGSGMDKVCHGAGKSAYLRPGPSSPGWFGAANAHTRLQLQSLPRTATQDANQTRFTVMRTGDVMESVTLVFPCPANTAPGWARFHAWKHIALIVGGTDITTFSPASLDMLDKVLCTRDERLYREELETTQGEIHLRLPLFFDPNRFGGPFHKSGLTQRAGTTASNFFNLAGCMYHEVQVYVDWDASDSAIPCTLDVEYVLLDRPEQKILSNSERQDRLLSDWKLYSSALASGLTSATREISLRGVFTDMMFGLWDTEDLQYVPLDKYLICLDGHPNVAQTVPHLQHQWLQRGLILADHVYLHTWDNSSISGEHLDIHVTVHTKTPLAHACVLHLAFLRHTVGRFVNGIFGTVF
jgi:hypothetical protein